jgi:hypothetical protein
MFVDKYNLKSKELYIRLTLIKINNNFWRKNLSEMQAAGVKFLRFIKK